MATPRDPLAASSYHDPRDAKDAYKEARKSVVDMALEMGYERSTMIEHGVHWADDLDQFRHMKSSALVSMWMSCGVRIFESFAEYLGSKFEDLMNAKGVICVSKNYTVNVLRQVTYPDSVS